MRDYTIQMVEVNGKNASKRRTIPFRFGVIESMQELEYAHSDVIYVKGNALRIKVESKKEMGNLIFSVTPDLPGTSPHHLNILSITVLIATH